MNGAEQVEYETGVRNRYAVISVIAGVLLVLSAVIQLSGPHTNVDELTLDLITAHKRFPLDLIGATIDALGLAALAVTLNWLDAISKARNPEIRSFIRWLALVGAGVSGLMAVAYAIVIAMKAHDFVTGGVLTYMRADSLTTGGLIVALPLLAQLGSLLLTAGFIWISLNSLRVGLLTRFMGYLGVFAGALVLFPIGSPVPVVQGFWLVSMGIMFSGRWPGGEPAAWAAGAMVELPPMGGTQGGPQRGQRGQGAPRARAARERPPSALPGQATLMKFLRPTPPPAAPATPTSTSTSAGPDDDSGASRTRANTPKRKRKRRN